MAGYIPHQPSPRQREFLGLDCLEALYGGAAGGGKSDALLMAALQGVHVPGYSALLLRRTYADLSLPGALMDRAHEWLQGTGAEWSERDKRWTFPSGASLGFGYLETARDRYRYQGAELQFIGFDEATQFELRDYQYLFSRLRSRHTIRVPLRMRAATNPGGIGHRWVQERWGIPDAGSAQTITHDGRVFVPSLMTDNPGLDVASYRNAIAQLDAVTRAQLESGSWLLDVSGLVYRFDAARHLVQQLPDLGRDEYGRPLQWHYSLGIDYGFRDETAWCVWAWGDQDRCAYLVHAEKTAEMLPSETAQRTQELVEQYQPEIIVGDPAAAGYIAEARDRFGIPVQAATKTDKRGAIRLLNGALENGTARILAGPGTEPWRTEASTLLWKDERQRLEHPALPNHCCDAALYAWRETRAHLAVVPDVRTGRVMDPYERARIEAAQREEAEQRWQRGLAIG